MRSRYNPARVLECSVYRSSGGYEVRAGYEDDVLCAYLESDVETARIVANDLRLAVIASAAFVPTGDGANSRV
jgi:hypothetical protein